MQPRCSRTGAATSLFALGGLLHGVIVRHPLLRPLRAVEELRKLKVPQTRGATAASASSRRSLPPSSATVQANGAVGGVNGNVDESHNVNSLTAPEVRDDGSFENRIFSCLVISPPGRPLREFTSILEFLQAGRDVIKALGSLSCNANIVHRDVSENNLIIPEAEQEGGPRGMLIDLDLGKELDGGPSGARHRTGTMEFMAIEVLEGKPHTYRHDLESFFYVFLWVIISHHPGESQTLSKESQLRDWYRGSYTQMANTKRGHMDKKAFKGILAEFLPIFESLKGPAEELRDILFPYRDGLFTGTYKDPDRLYQPMIKVFERAITQYGVIDEGQSRG